MVDKRKLKRKHLIYYLSVKDKNTDQRLGQLVNITTQGIMLTSEQPIQVNRIFQLQMLLPQEIKGKTRISFEALSLWCKRGINPDFYESGFELLDISPENIQVIEHLIFDFSFQG